MVIVWTEQGLWRQSDRLRVQSGAVASERFQRAIQLAQGNQAKAARWLKVPRQTLREKLQSFGLKAPTDKDGADEGAA